MKKYLLFFTFLVSSMSQSQVPYYFDNWNNGVILDTSIYEPKKYHIIGEPSANSINSTLSLRTAVFYNLPFNLIVFIDSNEILGTNGVSDVATTDMQFGGGYKITNEVMLKVTQSKYDNMWAGASVAYRPQNSIKIGSAELLGYGEFYFFPAHNELDPNPGIPFEDRVCARYSLDLRGKIIDKSINQNLALTVRSFIILGDSRPQLDYNYKSNMMGIDWQFGIEYAINKNFTTKFIYTVRQNTGGLVSGQSEDNWTAFVLQYKV